MNRRIAEKLPKLQFSKAFSGLNNRRLGLIERLEHRVKPPSHVRKEDEEASFAAYTRTKEASCVRRTRNLNI